MRVHVYKEPGDTVSVFIEPSPGKGRPPVLLQGITPANVRGKILPELVAMRAPREPRHRQLPLE